MIPIPGKQISIHFGNVAISVDFLEVLKASRRNQDATLLLRCPVGATGPASVEFDNVCACFVGGYPGSLEDLPLFRK